MRDDTERSLELLREVRALHDSDPALYRRIKQLPPKSRCARQSNINTLTQSHINTIAYLSSPQKKAFYLVSDRVRELSFLDAVGLFRAEPMERAVPFGDNEQRHYEQVRSAMAQYTADQQHQYREERPKIGGRDNDAKKAAAFLREVRPSLMNDDEARRTLDRLKQLIERGTYNRLADHLNRMSRKHKKTPMSTIDIVEQLEVLDQRYSENSTAQATSKPAVAATADVILSETFV